MTDVITTSQIEPILDDFLGVDCPHYEELRKRCAQRIVDLYANSRAASEWRDISTAPRDGRQAIVYRPLAHMSGDQPVAVKRLVKGNHHCWDTTVPPGETPNNPTADGSCHVTHWMPLPAPPQRNEEPRG